MLLVALDLAGLAAPQDANCNSSSHHAKKSFKEGYQFWRGSQDSQVHALALSRRANQSILTSHPLSVFTGRVSVDGPQRTCTAWTTVVSASFGVSNFPTAACATEGTFGRETEHFVAPFHGTGTSASALFRYYERTR